LGHNCNPQILLAFQKQRKADESDPTKVDASWLSFLVHEAHGHPLIHWKTHMFRSIIKLYMGIYIYIWLVVYLTLWKIWLRQLGWWNYQLNGKNVPNLWCCTFVHKWSNKSICNYPTPSHSATHLKKTWIPHLTNCIPPRKWAGFRGNKSMFRFNMI
jgi:hypothetical protein